MSTVPALPAPPAPRTVFSYLSLPLRVSHVRAGSEPTLLSYGTSWLWPVTQWPVPSSPQIQKWGNVEWAHDYELQDLRARTAAGALFVHLCSESSAVKHKLLQG